MCQETLLPQMTLDCPCLRVALSYSVHPRVSKEINSPNPCQYINPTSTFVPAISTTHPFVPIHIRLGIISHSFNPSRSTLSSTKQTPWCNLHHRPMTPSTVRSHSTGRFSQSFADHLLQFPSPSTSGMASPTGPQATQTVSIKRSTNLIDNCKNIR
jgi:hypothetical protein